MIYDADHGRAPVRLHVRRKKGTTRLRCKSSSASETTYIPSEHIGIPKCRSTITNVDPKAPSPKIFIRWTIHYTALIEHVQTGRHFPFHLSASPRQLQDTGISICKSVCRSGLRPSRARRSGSVPRPASPFAWSTVQTVD
jgi:hypothetical protein